jgi:hypothetical protein
MLRKLALSLFIICSAVTHAQTMAAVYYSPSAGVWQPLTSAAAFGQISTVPPLQIQAYCQASAGAQWSPCSFSGGGGSGTVTSFSAGNLSPLFTTSVATSTTTPALTFSLSNAAQNSVFAGPASGGAGTPSYQTAPTISAANMTNFPTFNQSTTGSAASLSVSGQTGLITFTGITSTNRTLTVRDAADTILELGGSYTPTGTWTWTSCSSCVWPTFNQNTTGTAGGLSGSPAITVSSCTGCGGSSAWSAITSGANTQTGAFSTTAPWTFSVAGAASTPGLSVTGAPYTGGSATTNFPQFYVNDGAGPTTFSTAGTEFGLNSPSGFTGNMADFHVNGGGSIFKVDYQGNLGLGGTTATYFDFAQGSSSAAVGYCPTANSICFQAPTSVTYQLRVFAGSPATGFPLYTNSSGTMTETITGVNGTLNSGVGLLGTLAVNTVLSSTVAAYAGHFTNLQVVTALGGTCTTLPQFNVFDGTSNVGSTVTANASTQTKGTGNSTAQTLTFAAGDVIGIYISTAGGTCVANDFIVSAQYSTP